MNGNNAYIWFVSGVATVVNVFVLGLPWWACLIGSFSGALLYGYLTHNDVTVKL